MNSELFFIKSGTGKIHIGNKIFDLKPNVIIIASPDTFYRVDCGKVDYICVGFNGNCLSPAVVTTDDESGTVANLLGEMKAEFAERKLQRREMMNLLLQSILILAFRFAGFSDDKKNFDNDNFTFIINYMAAKSHIGIDMEEVAKMSGLSYHRFRHRFKEYTGTSPQQFIIRQRINFAKRLLESTRYSTSSIAIACGFHSVPQFITCFNKQEGITPVKYRRGCLCKKSAAV